MSWEDRFKDLERRVSKLEGADQREKSNEREDSVVIIKKKEAESRVLVGSKGSGDDYCQVKFESKEDMIKARMLLYRTGGFARYRGDIFGLANPKQLTVLDREKIGYQRLDDTNSESDTEIEIMRNRLSFLANVLVQAPSEYERLIEIVKERSSGDLNTALSAMQSTFAKYVTDSTPPAYLIDIANELLNSQFPQRVAGEVLEAELISIGFLEKYDQFR